MNKKLKMAEQKTEQNNDIKIRIKSKEGEDAREVVTVPKSLVDRSTTLSDMLKDFMVPDMELDVFDIENVDKPTFELLKVYANHYSDENNIPTPIDGDTKLNEWDEKFFQYKDDNNNICMSHDTLKSILVASDYLGMKNLLDTGCKAMANRIKGKSVEEMREIFGVENDFSKEEEDRIMEENKWMEES